MKWFQDITTVQDISCDRVWVIGDLHGCADQLKELLNKLNRTPYKDTIVFVGDICDRGPKSFDTLKSIMHMCQFDFATAPVYVVLGNHDAKLLRALNGSKVQFNNGLDKTWEELQANCTQEELQRIRAFLQGLPLTIRVHTPKGDCIIVHAGFDKQMAGYNGPWGKGKSVEYAIFGPTDGKLANGFPNRIPWEDSYLDYPHVFYGHKVMGDYPKFTVATCGLDTGCWESGILTAVSFPNLEVIQTSRYATKPL